MSKITRFQDVPQFTRSGSYEIDVAWEYLPRHLESWKAEGRLAGVDLDPDFQRGHVWTKEKQIAFVEFGLRGGVSSRMLYFNCAGWMRDYRGPFVLVDGKQRITAVLAFLNNEIPAFGSLYSEYTDRLNLTRPSFRVNVNDLKTRAEVLQWYLDLNSGGVVHTSEELDRVRTLLEAEKK